MSSTSRQAKQPALARRRRALLPCAIILVASGLAGAGDAQAGSLRFFGNGVNDIDRVKIRVDDPADNNPGPPADVGNDDFTVEFWLRARTDNGAGTFSCGSNNNWILGNIIIDRDRFSQGREWGISLGGGRLAFGVANANQNQRTICGYTDIRDDRWHHVAVQRRRSDGRLWLWVDGVLESEQDGPDGDISYPDDGEPIGRCGASQNESCDFSDPFLVIGAEKHDAPGYSSFSGWVDEIRISTTLRYSDPFVPQSQRFIADADTAALYHFDEGAGDFIGDAAFNSLSPGERRFGGSPAGPVWSADSPVGPGFDGGYLQFSSSEYAVSENGGSIEIDVSRTMGSAGAATVDYTLSGGSASAGGDYRFVEGTLSWPDGDSSARRFVIDIFDDPDAEGDETVSLVLYNATGSAALGTTSAATLTIVDDEGPDSDGDGVPDAQDAFPNDPTETTDTDGDGIGNNADPDDDNDGVPDEQDQYPLGQFADAPPGYWAFRFIESLARAGITGGCRADSFCPETKVTRAQFAVFVTRALRGANFSPPPATGSVFLDVGANDFAAAYIETLYRDGITSGCGNGKFCPNAAVTRAGAAVMLLKAMYGPGFVPAPAAGLFDDVPPGYWAAAWIEEFANAGITGGCGGGNFCPASTISRAQIAVFLVRAFEL